MTSYSTFPGTHFATMAAGVGSAMHAGVNPGMATSMVGTLPYQGPASSPLAMNPVKGIFVERLADRLLTRASPFSAGEWQTCAPARVGRTGIDNLFVRSRPGWKAPEVLVADGKYGSSRLDMTSHGRQLGPGWTRRWLLKSAHTNRGAPTPMGRQSARSMYLGGKGRLPYQVKEVRVEAVGNQHRIIVKSLDPRTGLPTGKPEVIRGTHRQLSPDVRRFLEKSYRDAFREGGYDAATSRKLAKRSAQDPQFFRDMSRKPSWPLSAGLDLEMLKVGAKVAIAAAFIDAAVQLVAERRIDLKRTAITGGVGLVGGAAGRYAATQLQIAMGTTKVGQHFARLISPSNITGSFQSALAAGAVVGVALSALFSYGGLLFGRGTLKEANRSMMASTAGIVAAQAVAAGTFGLIAAFGTAGTGAAISSLSGAAATSATLAWLGGGTVAAGGGGMAAGTVIAATGYGVIVIVVVAGVGVIFKVLDEREKRNLIEGRLEVVGRALREGRVLA